MKEIKFNQTVTRNGLVMYEGIPFTGRMDGNLSTRVYHIYLNGKLHNPYSKSVSDGYTHCYHLEGIHILIKRNQN